MGETMDTGDLVSSGEAVPPRATIELQGLAFGSVLQFFLLFISAEVPLCSLVC